MNKYGKVVHKLTKERVEIYCILGFKVSYYKERKIVKTMFKLGYYNDLTFVKNIKRR